MLKAAAIKGLKNLGLNGDSNPDLNNAYAVLNQLTYQAKWEQMVRWVVCMP